MTVQQYIDAIKKPRSLNVIYLLTRLKIEEEYIAEQLRVENELDKITVGD